MIAVQPVPERIPLYVGHDVEEERVRLTGVMQREDVGVLQVRRRLDLGQESLGPDYSS